MTTVDETTDDASSKALDKLMAALGELFSNQVSQLPKHAAIAVRDGRQAAL